MTAAMLHMTQRLGYVYALKRVDLNLCYVGQSVHADRPSKHLKPGRYQYDVLCGDGERPTIETLQADVLEGDDLDQVERDWMRQVVAEGWTLVNRIGPDDATYLTAEWGSYAGKLGGAKGGRSLAARRTADPEFDALWREKAAKAGNAALRARRAADPEFDRKCREAETRGGATGAATRAMLRSTDPVWALRESEIGRRGGLAGGRNGGLATAKLQYYCVECGLGPTTPGGLGYHQSRTGHAGRRTPVQKG